MKRKHATGAAHASNKGQETSPAKKKARASKSNAQESEEPVQDLERMEEMIDVRGFLLRDCQASSKILVEQAKLRAAELRRQLEEGKKVLLDALEAEKENLDKDGNAIPRAFTISVRCVTGPYRGRKFSIDIDVKRHSSCFIGRSTGRKFRSPRGVSMPKDSELSTSHGEIKMETSGKVFFIDLDSTNGTRIGDVELEPNEPYELTIHKPVKVEVGAGEYELTFEEKA
ncbi:hypothetical protein PHYPSEUDO_006149 [Phytophthora pseudosyringae]|uniref:FHA domain-containing protein n=1 Tax=Phytophthora pseudosyringae TaxID=221518 RepID=A0A8T1WFB9_9STRA|nr:hypothetical protein PHYPSEUDO_006149 [Phytophthora pseudosyringae]